MKKFLACLLLLILTIVSFAQDYASYYVAPKEPEVKAKLEQWKDLKFGMIIHWGSEGSILRSLPSDEAPLLIWFSRS